MFFLLARRPWRSKMDRKGRKTMGFPYDTGDWSGIFAEGASGVMFTGWGGSAPGWYTLIAVIICIVVLVMGNGSEAQKYKNAEK